MNNGILGKSVLGFCEFLWPMGWDSRLLAALVNISWTGPPTLSRHFRRRYPSKVLDLRHFSRISVGGGHKASRASPLGRARAACFECSALVPAEHGAVGCELLLLYWMEIWKQHRPWSANTPADHYLVIGRTIAGQNQGRRFKAFSANETQRVRTECFVRMLSFRQELNFERC